MSVLMWFFFVLNFRSLGKVCHVSLNCCHRFREVCAFLLLFFFIFVFAMLGAESGFFCFFAFLMTEKFFS